VVVFSAWYDPSRYKDEIRRPCNTLQKKKKKTKKALTPIHDNIPKEFPAVTQTIAQ
jgi:hypothetical protein